MFSEHGDAHFQILQFKNFQMLGRKGSAKMFDSYEHGLQARQLTSAKLTSTLISRNSELENYNRLQVKLAQLTEQHALLQLQTSQTRDALLKERRTTEQTASQLRSTIDELTTKLKSLTIALNDALGEADSLAELKHQRDEDIDQLNDEAQELRAISEKITQDRAGLQAERNNVEAEVRDVEARTLRLQGSHASMAQKLERAHGELLELHLAWERKGDRLGQYQIENNRIDAELTNRILREQELLSKAEQLEEYIKELQFEQTEAQCDASRLQSCLADTRSYLASERQKYTELNGKLKHRERLLAKLQKQIQEQALQADYLVRKNGQICDINSTLRKDYALSERHMQALIRNNEQLNNQIENFRKQDRSILAQIQNRTTPRLAKLDESKVTEVSCRLKASRLESPMY